MKAHIVIGANYGDEGKGLITDYLVEGLQAKWVVRFNGGAQAGHTVQRNGVRHVFRHFGSGTLAGANTYLARQFVCNPAIFVEEYGELRMKLEGNMPMVAVDPDCIVTTPLDMLVNRAIEQRRADARHGSCGVGFGQTIERHQHPMAQLRVADLGHPKIIEERLRYIIDGYYNKTIAALSLDPALIDQARMMSSRFMADCEFFWDKVYPCQIEEPLHDGYQHIVFEGAQGLLLSQDNSWDFPHVTRSYTGARNTVPLLYTLNIQNASFYYVTRSYLTRHGAGPFPEEQKGLASSVTDETNKPNDFQGSMRFAPLDFESLKRRVSVDYEPSTRILDHSVAMVVATCLDEVPNRELEVGCPIQSYGPTAESVRWLGDCLSHCDFRYRPKTVDTVPA